MNKALFALFIIVIGGYSFLQLKNDDQFKIVDGSVITSSDLKGKPALINFWSVSCPPCIKEMPELNSLYKKYKSQGVNFIGVAMANDPPNIVIRFSKELGVKYPIALDLDKKLVRSFDAKVVPTTYLLDSNGNIAHKIIGVIDPEEIIIQLNELLEG